MASLSVGPEFDFGSDNSGLDCFFSDADSNPSDNIEPPKKNGPTFRNDIHPNNRVLNWLTSQPPCSTESGSNGASPMASLSVSPEFDSGSDNSGLDCFFSDSDSNPSDKIEPLKKRGRIFRHNKYPKMVKYAEEFLDLCSVGAHNRRKDSTEYWCGSTAKDMTTYVNRRIHGERGGNSTGKCTQYVSRHTVRRLGLPAHDGFKAASHYKGFIKARRAQRQNDLVFKEETDFQYTATQIKHLLELAAIFADNVILLSVDNKSKVSIGIQAVSHLIRPRGLHKRGRTPNLHDHSFGPRRCKLVPSGYMEMGRPIQRSQSARQRDSNLHRCLLPRKPGRARSLSPLRKYPFRTYRDENDRERLRMNRHGKLHLFVFSEYFHSSTSTRHANQLHQLLASMISSSGKSVVYLISDGGPDWKGTSLITLLNYGRLWRELRLDSLVVARYAAYHSKYNMIERRWAPLTKRLSAVTFDTLLPGETQSPWDQKISADAKREKCVRIFDKAVTDCCAYLRPDVFKGHGVSATPVFANSADGDIFDEVEHARNVILFQNINAAWRHQNPALTQEVAFVISHCRRSLYKFEFSRCANQRCECNEAPVRATSYMKLLEALGGCIPTPETDICHRGHYRTLLSTVLNPNKRQLDGALDQTRIHRCDVCQFLSFSAAANRYHRMILH